MSHLLIRILISLSARAALNFQIVFIIFVNNIIVVTTGDEEKESQVYYRKNIILNQFSI